MTSEAASTTESSAELALDDVIDRSDVLGYRDKRVVVTGAASGMGEATALLLRHLGASVTALDIKPVNPDLEQFVEVDLRDRVAIEAAVDAIDGPVDALFSCAGLPGPPFTALDTITVNFVGTRHLAQRLLANLTPGAAIGVVSSTAALGWQRNLEMLVEFVTTDGFDGALSWLEDHREVWESGSGYGFSKEALDAWVTWWSTDLVEHDVRVNCINPGPTQTPMTALFEAAKKGVVTEALGPLNRRATPTEQAWPLVMLNSPRMRIVNGEALWTDGGFFAGLTTGRTVAEWAVARGVGPASAV